MTLRIPAANKKLGHLCAMCKTHGGKLTTFKAVAAAVDLSEGRISQLFNASDAGAENSIKPEVLGNIVRVFREEGINVNANDFYTSSFEAFVVATTLSDLSCVSSLLKPAQGGHESHADLKIVEWSINEAETFTELAIVNLHRPTLINSAPENYQLNVSIRFEPTEFSWGDTTLVIGLNRAVAIFDSSAYQIAYNSLLGDSERYWEGISPGKSGVIIQPVSDTDMLSGSPLGGHHLAIIEPTSGADTKVAIELEAPRRSFVFELLEENKKISEISPTKDAILNLVYGEAIDSHLNTQTNRYRLARASMQHKLSSD